MGKSKELFMWVREKEVISDSKEKLPAFYIDQQIKSKLKEKNVQSK